MKPIALIVDDDPSIRAALADRLESFGHDCDTAGSQGEARERIENRIYSYVLLDMELPVRFGRPASIAVGKNVLRDIRASGRNKTTPVVVVTAHGHDGPDLAVDLMRAGANHFVKKPFANLELAIQEVLGSNGAKECQPGATASAPAKPDELEPLGEAKLVYYPDRIELNGLDICEPDNGVIWRMLNLLKERKANGQPKAFPGKRVAEDLGLTRGQNAVCDAVSAFRKKLINLLAENGIAGTEDTVVTRGKSGYQLNPALAVDDQSHQAPRKTKEELGESPADRQEWILGELRDGRRLRRKDLEKRFKISTATAKRDFGLLDGRVEFTGTGASGHYVLRT